MYNKLVMILTRRTLILIGVVTVLIVAGAILITWRAASTNKIATQNNSPAPQQALKVESKTVLPLPANVTVPEMNSNASGDAAKPDSVVPQAAGVDSKIRTFDIKIVNNAFTPNTVAIHVGDVAHLNFTAVDQDYDFVQPDTGFSGTVPKGKTKFLEGQFSGVGKFVLYCAKCGGPDKGPLAYIIVAPR